MITCRIVTNMRPVLLDTAYNAPCVSTCRRVDRRNSVAVGEKKTILVQTQNSSFIAFSFLFLAHNKIVLWVQIVLWVRVVWGRSTVFYVGAA